MTRELSDWEVQQAQTEARTIEKIKAERALQEIKKARELLEHAVTKVS